MYEYNLTLIIHYLIYTIHRLGAWLLPDFMPYFIGQCTYMWVLYSYRDVNTITLIMHYYKHTIENIYYLHPPTFNINACLLLVTGHHLTLAPTHGWSLYSWWIFYA